MKKIINLLLVLIITHYALFATDYLTLYGKIKNQNSDKLIIRQASKNKLGYFDTIKEISLNKEGSFSDTLSLTAGYYNIYDGSESTAIFLKNGYNVAITIDTKEFDETIKYVGKGAEPNNFLANKYLTYENADKDFEDIFGSNEKIFLKKLNTLKSSLKNELSKVKNEDEFIEKEEKSIEYDYLIRLQNYQRYHRYVTHDHNFKVSPDFLKPLNNIDIDNIKDFETIPEYSSFLTEYILGSLQEERGEDVISKLLNIKHKEIKDFLIQGLQKQLSPRNNANDAVYSVLLKLVKDEKNLASIKKRYSALKHIAKGNPSPQFSYKDINGKTLSLTDFKGNYIYIDVWATWCAPCLAEIPNLKDITKEYIDKPIKFISISVDSKKDFKKWENFVKDKKLDGIQLYADKSWKSDFIREFLVESIPRFILLDKEGKIIDNDAPRPSNPDLKNQIDKLLK